MGGGGGRGWELVSLGGEGVYRRQEKRGWEVKNSKVARSCRNRKKYVEKNYKEWGANKSEAGTGIRFNSF